MPVWESAASAAYLVNNHGVDPGAIFMETTSYDTIGNAYFTRVQICDVKGWENVWVVTSEFHMPRTKAIFEWIFAASGGPPKRRYRMSFLTAGEEVWQLSCSWDVSANDSPPAAFFFPIDNVGISEAGIKERKARESRQVRRTAQLASAKRVLTPIMRVAGAW